ncbi:MAG: hypothetical protein KatS3mg108_0457 [Isosphaeraceae bacterium]|jgi:hypothetical protein|nr:MAG: hypothetical protein KatS3mg108_0457 [Isosphaeraceae bacterium]
MKPFVRRPTPADRRLSWLGAFVVGLSLAGARPAWAQWGWGWGWGWGFGGGQIGNMAIMNNINDRSAAAASAAYAARQTMPGAGRVYGGNPNAYINRTREATFFERFDPSTRRSLSQQMSRLPARAGAPAGTGSPAAAALTAARTVLPLASFFSEAGVLVWPAGAPTDGPLESQKAAADSSVTSVYREVRNGGRAPVALVTNARTALVEYGQAALDYLRAHTTPAVVDGFHRFLLSLYDSLGQAALGPSTTRG